MDNSTLFSVVIRDNSGDEPVVYTAHKSDLPWVLLSEFQDSYFIYSWNSLTWKSITRQEFTKFRVRNQYVLIQTGLSKSWWLELPITSRDAKLLDKSKAVKKIPRREPLNEYVNSSQSEAGLRKFIETERLLDDLSRDDY
jgi:hypothetical protein